MADSDHEHDPLADKVSIEDEKEQLLMAVKYGLKQQLATLLERNRGYVDLIDADGNSLAHWAAKSGNVEILQQLREKGAKLDFVARSNTGMTPMHWAASDGKIAALRYLLDSGLNPDCRDAAGCTPLVVATQHEHLLAVIFLVQYGVDPSVVDCNGDTALHWAAYKGSLDLVGYLSYAIPSYLTLGDRYGQTPLHLATIRGNLSVVEYLVKECKQNCLVKDSSGSSSIDLAHSKDKFPVEWFLRRSVGPTLFHVANGMGWGRFCQCRIYKLIACGHAPEEAGVWAWRIVFFSNLAASFVSLQFMQEPALSDLVWSSYFNMFVQCMWWFCFLGCLLVGPGDVVDVPNAQNKTRYDRALDLVLAKEGELGDIKLCHSCHVQRPLRSKHDKVSRKCVHKFDHHCPFVGNTVGRDNHRFFLGLCIFHQFCFFGFVYSSIYYGYRVEMSWSLILFICYAGLWDMMMMGLGSYHVQLISTNMTTNESMGVSKYSYFKDSNGSFDNPFCRGNPWSNLFDTLVPYKTLFYTRDEVVSYISRIGPSMSGGSSQCCHGGSGHDHGHSHGHSGGHSEPSGHSHGHSGSSHDHHASEDARPLLDNTHADHTV